MKVLVAYASRHGATRGIAERVAQTLERRGLDVTLRPVERAGAADAYDAYVIGGAAYMFHWLKEATGFVRGHRALLASRPVWLFSSGPLGAETITRDGQDAREAATPKEFAELAGEIHPRDRRVFFGAYDPNAKPIGFMERMTRMMPAAREAFPVGDFRDWPEIDAWAADIAAELTTAPAGRQPARDPGRQP
jgi:menaquinone-dependent protoporphyrinogen oxidase